LKKSTVVILCMLLIGISCEKPENNGNGNKEPAPLTLQGTEWKLVGIFDAEADTLIKELEPKDVEPYYTLAFSADGYSSRSTIGFAYRHYEADYKASCLYFLSTLLNYRNETAGGKLYHDIVLSSRYFSLQSNELKLYNDNMSYLLNNQTYYLLFNRVESPQEISSICGVWLVKALRKSGELITINSPINPPDGSGRFAPNIVILIPDTTQSGTVGCTFYNTFSTEFEIKEGQQIRFKGYGSTRSAEDDCGWAFKENLLSTVKFNISNNELVFMDSLNNPIIIFINHLNKN